MAPRANVVEPLDIRSLRAQAHDSLREAIISGRLKCGERLNERLLSADLGISTSPLKEAFRLLEGEGLIRTEARRGSYVTFSAKQAEEMTMARAALESIMARQAARHGSDEQLAELPVIIEQMRAALNSGSEVLIELNENFHDAIHIASGCNHLRRLQSAQQMYDHAARVTVLNSQDARVSSFAEHEAIMRAIVTRQDALAEKLMRDHIETAGRQHIALVF